MNRFERAISQNGGSLPRFELPTNPQELQTPESLGIVLRNAQRLLSDYAISSLPRIAERFEQDGSSTDPTVRGQIQEELVQIGLRMQQFGALLLDLGSSILTLRLEQSTKVQLEFLGVVVKMLLLNCAPMRHLLRNI
ncbi:uncharacterized protein LOC120087140 isoform X2 [Benincasa hispida]|uniref:uncharacterized protein LOC120087140 isoform X2 n=1 Tax=Benincasa hispida TaxID=102211 RepID=UPI001900C72F|nr:uncharacterized protein LOC120087140 isoform X2 [Benincasa hispida]